MKWLTLWLGLACTPLCADWRCGTFEVQGAALFLRPTACDFPFAISDGRPFTTNEANNAHLPVGEHREVDPKYEWGFRVGLSYHFDCQDINVKYSHLHAEDTSKLGGPFWPSFAHPRYMGFVSDPGGSASFAQSPFFSDSLEGASVRSRIDFEYDAIDLQWAWRSLQGCRWELRSYVGLHLADMLHRFRSDYQGVLEPGAPITATALTEMRFKECSWGIGPLAGVDLELPIGCGFGVGGHLGLAILAGKRDGDVYAADVRNWMGVSPPEDVDEMIFVHMDEKTVVFPYARASAGIHYRFCLCGLVGLIDIAYEFHDYINALHTFRFNDERATGTFECTSFSLNGLVLSIYFCL